MNLPKFSFAHFKTASQDMPESCVHVARGLGWAAVRDTKQHFGSDRDVTFTFTAADFTAALEAIRQAAPQGHELPAGALAGTCLSIDTPEPGVHVMRSNVEQPAAAGSVLVFDDAEMRAFFRGVVEGFFDGEGDHTPHGPECVTGCGEPMHVEFASV